MARRSGGLTFKAVENLQARDERYEIPDPGCAGLYLQVHPSGAKSWCFRYRHAGKSKKLTIGTAFTDKGVEVIKIGAARDIADKARVSVAGQIDPAELKKEERKKVAAEAAASETTLKVIAERYLAQPEHKRLRSIEHRRKALERLVFPVLGDRQVATIKRSEIINMLDGIAKSRGPVMADFMLAMVRRLLGWYAIQSDDYASPIVRGMARTSTKERARKRTLTDIEIRALWRAVEKAGLFGQYCQFLLLTATRRNEAARMVRSELDGTDWTIPADRYKTKLDHLIPMSSAAVQILSNIPKIGRTYIFATPDGKPIGGFGCRKEALDKLMLAEGRVIAEEGGDDPSGFEMQRWTLHDLRRTARTLMSRAGVQSDHAERCLGHVVGGVEGTYDRHEYLDEKRQAFAKLAELVDRIVKPTDNVIALIRKEIASR